MAVDYPPDSPTISPRKTLDTSAIQSPSPNGASAHDANTLSPNKSGSMHEKVARLSIHGIDPAERNLLKSLQDKASKNGDGSAPKRRRSSVMLHNNQSGSFSRKNSMTSMKVIKKKKKMNKPIEVKPFEKFLEKGISIKDIRDLTLFMMNATNNMPQWLTIRNRPHVPKMVVLFMPGLEPLDFGPGTFDKFSQIGAHGKKVVMMGDHLMKLIENSQTMPLTAPGSKNSLYSAYNSFINVGLTKNEKKEKKELLATKKVTIPDLVMTLDQLLENGYPIHPFTKGMTDEDRARNLEENNSRDDSDMWYNTIEFDHGGSHIFGLDCEMCLAGKDFVLTRVSVLDFQNNVMLDELVKPDVEITDYLTKYSGITKEKLDPVTTTLKDVQHKLLKLISSKDILIGHSLQSDLLTLKMRHPLIVDTAVIYDHKAGPPFKPALKYLASEYLGVSIQDHAGDGHDSVEDARTCIDLTKLKIENGLWFGLSINTENLFVRLAEKSGKRSLLLNGYVSKNFSGVDDHQGGNGEGHMSRQVRCTTDSEIFDNIEEHIEDFDIIVGRLRELEFVRGYAQRPMHLGPAPAETAEDVIAQTNSQLDRVYKSLPAGGMILLVSGSGDVRDYYKLMHDFNELNKEERTKARQEREGELSASVAKARDSVVSLIVKTERPE